MPDDSAQPERTDPGSKGGPPHGHSTTPRDLKVRIKEQRLIIEWMDGTRSEYSLDELRRHCPCAACRTRRLEQADNPLTILTFDPTDVRVTHAQLVGAYAVAFHWSDGHDAGIFEFSYLRALAEGSK